MYEERYGFKDESGALHGSWKAQEVGQTLFALKALDLAQLAKAVAVQA